jgi:uncharacterized repeat protein (TIGR03803 family)
MRMNSAQNRGWFSGVRLQAAGFVLALAVVGGQWAQAQTYSVLYKFKGQPDGAYPSAVIQDAMGNLYGTTKRGGAYNLGTVFKLSKTGETVLYSFCPGGNPGTDGYNPRAGLIRDAGGNLYGTTTGGGTGCGCGVVFEVDTTGAYSVLYNFAGGLDGSGPMAGLIQDASGNFYGTTFTGGGSGCRNGYGCGTVFKLETTGKETVLYSFGGSSRDGVYPTSGVIQDANGNFYGETWLGGVHNKGTVFKLSNTGAETVLYGFRAKLYGGGPIGGLTQDANGNLYGTTAGGGNNNNGQVFKLSNTAKETALYRFRGGADGAAPVGGVIRDARGNLYGTTVGGGVHGAGTVFRLSRGGN